MLSERDKIQPALRKNCTKQIKTLQQSLNIPANKKELIFPWNSKSIQDSIEKSRDYKHNKLEWTNETNNMFGFASLWL